VSAFGAIVNNESQPSPSNSSEIYAQAADGQLNDELQGVSTLTSSLCTDTPLSTYTTPGTIPDTPLSSRGQDLKQIWENEGEEEGSIADITDSIRKPVKGKLVEKKPAKGKS
jgi:hypothetical protein